jgi:hypothetical protein
MQRALAQVGAIHYQSHFLSLPMVKQMADQLPIAMLPAQLPLLEKTS